MTLADLKRKPVVSMGDGTKIGDVDDLIIDIASWTIHDLYVATKTNRGVLPLANLKNIGPDAVTVESSTAAEWNAKAEGLCFAALKERTVIDGTGTVLGNITDLHYESHGAISSFEVHQGGVLGLGVKITTITPSEIRRVGEKLVTVEIASSTAE